MIAPPVPEHDPAMNDVRRRIAGHVDGAALVIAGPGSGTTCSSVLPRPTLLLQGKAAPGRIAFSAPSRSRPPSRCAIGWRRARLARR